MTIEDLIDIHLGRIERLNCFLRLAHLGRRGNESAIARKVRRRLIGEIGNMLEYEQEALEADLEYRSATTPAQRALDERSEPGCWDYEDPFETDFAVVPLLDAEPLAGDDGRMLDPATGEWFRPEAGYPRKITVAIEQLGELAAVVDQMQQNLVIGFTLDRFFWTENSFERWVIAEQMRIGRASAPAT